MIMHRPTNDILINNQVTRSKSASSSRRTSVSTSRSSSQQSSFSSIPTSSSQSSLSITRKGDAILDHNHLKPGQDASLLSHAQTINMYRANAKRINDLDVQYHLALLLIQAASDTPTTLEKKGYLSEAQEILKQLSAKGHPNAQYHLAKLLNKSDPGKAFSLLVKASKHFHVDAANRIGQCYEDGLGCKANGSKAVLFYKKAASLNHAGAMYRLGEAYMQGQLGLTKNPKEAIKWYTRSTEAATAEHPEAIHALAHLYTIGIPHLIFIDQAYAVQLYTEAADVLNHAPSAYKLGQCYEYGQLKCKQNPALSIHYYTIAAEKGHQEACFALTAWYLVGAPEVQLPQSDDKSFWWAKQAAELGLAKAQYAVGYFMESGIGCMKDNREATLWYQKAANQGDKRALHRLQGKQGATQLDSKTTKCANITTIKKERLNPTDNCKIM